MRQIATKNQQTGLLRLAAILLPTALLAACGGGGGGGAAAPVVPPVVTETPPDFLISETEAVQAIQLVNGTAPDDNAPSPSELASRIVNIAQMPNIALQFSEIGTGEIEASRMITCTRGTAMCDAMVDMGMGSGPEPETYAIEDIDGPVLLNDGEGLAGYNDGFDIVMTDEGIPLVQARAAGRIDGVRYEFQGYGGWLDYSAFVIQYQNAMVGGRRQSLYSAYSFGNANNVNPTANARWDGVMVGVAKDDGDIIQGEATIQWDKATPNSIGGLFNNIRNLTEGGDFSQTLMTWKSIPLENGAFGSDDAFLVGTGSIHGNFYGDNNEEVGGIFDMESIIGAFGAKK